MAQNEHKDEPAQAKRSGTDHVIICGLQNMATPPYRKHELIEIPGIIEDWKRLRAPKRPRLDSHHMSAHIIGTVVSVSGSNPIEGFVLHGHNPFEGQAAFNEIAALAAMLMKRFGQLGLDLYIDDNYWRLDMKTVEAQA